MSLLRIARVPAITIEFDAIVVDAIHLMHFENVGCVFVVKNDLLVGAFSECDVMRRVLLSSINPVTTPIHQVMTMPAKRVSKNSTINEAIRTMYEGRVRRLPIVSGEGKVEGVVSLRYLLREKAFALTQECDALLARTLADGIGG